MLLVMSCLLSITCLSPAIASPDSPENIATFSVVAFDPATGEVGVAVQSKFFAVGTVVPWARAGVGAVASQAFGNPTYGPWGLDLMAAEDPDLTALYELDEFRELVAEEVTNE